MNELTEKYLKVSTNMNIVYFSKIWVYEKKITKYSFLEVVKEKKKRMKMRLRLRLKHQSKRSKNQSKNRKLMKS